MSTAATSAATSILEQFKWEPQPKAERWVAEIVAHCLGSLPEARQFGNRLQRESGVRFVDLVSHIGVSGADVDRHGFKNAGWSEIRANVYANRSGIFPNV